MKYLYKIIFLFLLMSVTCYADDMVKLTNMKVQPSTTMTRFTFLLSKKTCGTLRYFPNPDRVYVDIEKTTKDFNLQNVKLVGSNVLTMSSEEVDKTTLRFTFMTTSRVRWNLQIRPYGDKGQVVLEVDIISAKNEPEVLPAIPTKEKFDAVITQPYDPGIAQPNDPGTR